MTAHYAAAFFGNEFQASDGSTGGHYTSRVAEIVALGAHNMVLLDARPLTGAGHNIVAVDAGYQAGVAADIALAAANDLKVVLAISYTDLADAFNVGGDISDATGWSNLLTALSALIDPADTNPTVYGFYIDEPAPSADALYLSRTGTLRTLYPYVRTMTTLNIDDGAHAAGTFAQTTDGGLNYYFFEPSWAAAGRTRALFEAKYATAESYFSNGQDIWLARDTYIDGTSAGAPGVATSLTQIIESINYHYYWAQNHHRVVGIFDFCYCADSTGAGATPLYGLRQINDVASLAHSAATIHWLQTINRYWMGSLQSVGQLYGGGTYPVDAYIGGEWNPTYASNRAYPHDNMPGLRYGGEHIRPGSMAPEVSR